MPVLSQDIKLLKSDTFNDSATGGGRKVKQEIINGASNNMFEDISTIDTVNGAVNIRKVFPSLENQTAEPGLGSHIMVARVAGDTLQDMVLMESNATARRPEMSAQLESYLNEGATTPFILYGNAFAGSRVVNMFANPKNDLPQVGDVLILKSASSYDYFSIDSLEESLVTFTDAQGDYQRRVINVITRQAISFSYTGSNMSRETPLNPTTVIKYAAATNSAKYFGSKKTTLPAAVGDGSVNVTSVFGQLVPATRSETPILNQNVSGIDDKIVAAGTVYITRSVSINVGLTSYVGATITPGTVTINTPSLTIQGSNIKNASGVVVATIDYVRGIVQGTVSVGVYNITFIPGATTADNVRSFSKPITINNRSLVYVFTLPTVVTPGTIRVRYRALGKWYTLVDNGYGGFDGVGSGQILYDAKNFSVTLAAMPDVGSGIVVSYTNGVGFVARGSDTILPTVIRWRLPPGNYTNSVITISLNINSSSAAPVNITVPASGVINVATGVGTLRGFVDRQTGVITMYNSVLDFHTTNRTVTVTYSDLETKTYSTSALGRDANNRVTVVLPDQNIVPGSVRLSFITDASVPDDIALPTVPPPSFISSGSGNGFKGATYKNSTHTFNFGF